MMTTRETTQPHHIWLKLAALVLVVAVLSLPINGLPRFGLLAAGVLVVLTGLPIRNPRRWVTAILLALLIVGQKALLSAPRIEEGHNVFLIDGPGGALEKGLPAQAFGFMAKRFDAAYPVEKRCEAGTPYCWRPHGIPRRAFALAADGMFDGHEFSRRVKTIDFDNPIWLRLGIINDLTLDILGHDDDVQRLYRDRRSLAFIGRWHLLLPFFVMYRFPAEFAGSDLCWRGEVLWEGADEQFEPLVSNATRCRTLRSDDIGRRIFGVSIGPHADLTMTLNANWRIMLRRAVDAAVTLIGVVGVLLLLVRWRPRRTVLPLLFAALAIIVIVFTDITFIGGYRPFDGGDDGLIFSGFARLMLAALANGDPMGVLEGAEKVYGFTAGMRYFRMVEFLVFGDSFLGYLLLMPALPLVVWRLCARFIGVEWGLAFALLFMVPAGVLFGTTYTHYVIWAARGYADPLGAMAFLSGLLLLSGPAGQSFDDRVTRAFWGACLMAFAVVIRPNLALGAGVILGGVGLAALWQRHAARLAALCAGFTPALFPLWHNWHFGGVIVPFSDILTNANIYMVPPVTYWNALQEVGRLELTGANIARIVRHLGLWLSGPSEMAIMVPVHIAAIAILIRVACARSFEPMLRLTALAALALIPPAFVYLIAVRYHLALWLLAAVVSTAWIKYEGLALADARWPGLRERIAATRAAALASRGLTRLMAWT